MATTRLMTVENLEREGAPEGRWELIDGELVEMTPSSSESSRTGMRFGYYLTDHVLPRRLGEVFGTDSGFAVFAGREIVRVSDAAFVRADRIPPAPDNQGFFRLAPDLVVEVVSPSDRASDVYAKMMMWLEAGVQLVWVADPATRTIAVYRPDRSSQMLRETDELTGGDVLPQFRLKVATFFA